MKKFEKVLTKIIQDHFIIQKPENAYYSEDSVKLKIGLSSINV